MFTFIKNQWILGNFNATNIANCVTKGYINQTQADEIMVLPQN